MKKLKVLFLRGVPASGKTTWAKEFIKNNSNWVRVNRDDIRSMLSLKWNKTFEKTVKSIQLDSIAAAIEGGYNIIVDDTNTSKRNLELLKESILVIAEFSKNKGIKIKFTEKWFNIDLKEAIERDYKREKSVGATVIKSFYCNLKKSETEIK